MFRLVLLLCLMILYQPKCLVLSFGPKSFIRKSHAPELYDSPHAFVGTHASKVCPLHERSRESFSVSVSYDEGEESPPSSTRYSPRRQIDVPVWDGETILSALERAANAGVSPGTGGSGAGGGCLIPPPSDCRRGNCLTCTARHNVDSKVSNLQSMNDGLSPHVAARIAEKGYILTCSSTISGPGVSLTLGKNNQLWDYVYRHRLEEEGTEITAREAMAKAIRLSAERNVLEWQEQTERAYQESTDD